MRLLKGSWSAAVNFILSLQLHNVWRTWIQRGQLLISPLPTSIFLESTWIKRNLPMESVCRWELHVQKVLQMCEGMVTHLKWLFSFGFSHLFRSLSPKHKYCNHSFIDLGIHEAMKGKILLSPLIFKSSQWRPSHSPLGLLVSEVSHYWQDSPFSLILSFDSPFSFST